MEFYSRQAFPDLAKQAGFPVEDIDDFYKSRLQGEDVMEVWSEYQWRVSGYPYFNVWPVICEPLLRVRLNINGNHVRLPFRGMLLRFASKGGFQVGEKSIQTAVVAAAKVRNSEDGVTRAGIVVSADFGERDATLGFPVYETVSFATEGIEIEDELQRVLDKPPLGYRAEPAHGDIIQVVRLAIGVSLMHADPDLVTADVLSKDRPKLGNPNLTQEEMQAIIDRAHRRGKKGWDIGRSVQVDPHFRRPHLGVRWMQKEKGVKGDLEPRLRPVKGCIVKKDRATKVPTGYLSCGDAE